MSILPRLVVSDDHGNKCYFFAEVTEILRGDEVPDDKSDALAVSHERDITGRAWDGRNKDYDFVPFNNQYYGWWGQTVKEIPFTEAPRDIRDEAMGRSDWELYV